MEEMRRPQKPNPLTSNVEIFIKCGACAARAFAKLNRRYPNRVTGTATCANENCHAPHLIKIEKTSKRTVAKLLKTVTFEFIDKEN